MTHDLLHLLFAPSPLKLLALATFAVTLLCRYVLTTLAGVAYNRITPTNATTERRFFDLRTDLANEMTRDQLSAVARDAAALLKTLGWRTRLRWILLSIHDDIGISAFVLGALIGALFYPGPHLVSALLIACYAAVSASWLYRHIWWLRRAAGV
jgi:hypothetical protein